MFNNILVVCVGNICRSPIGERLLKQQLPHKNIASAGLASEKSRLAGKPADEMATLVASEHGLSLEGHQSKQLTPQLCNEFDLILVMEKGHISLLTEIAPSARGKTMLFGQWTGQQDIPDPYRQSKEAFDHVYKKIDSAAQQWSKKLK
ncbi:phosphotyrosine protein phosphatase [Vibrio cholerae]|nr:low molecular weight phosphotyrosine protein phosphatase [Vibrio cholerae]EJY4341101.1 low molecular weight phosphotyrosine protein phosphatase [Vibrio cholerae]EKF9835581.1 low molecular weight phosphotyrosine protein phosphatase [Vibrio cholerae]EKF9846721.1 low molecular weight phosphotyrosine protein phosphatase [Vibrio cholerae]ELG5194338.1 low molecular weight phosphotyrosine protein phosphatase [Vibrio cholerae]